MDRFDGQLALGIPQCEAGRGAPTSRIGWSGRGGSEGSAPSGKWESGAKAYVGCAEKGSIGLMRGRRPAGVGGG